MNCKKLHGVVYTPRWLVDIILNNVGFDGSAGTVIDPACGDGAFLSAVSERIVNNATDKTALKEHLQTAICGIDIDAAALDKCKKRLSAIALKAGISGIQWNLIHGDCLQKQTADAMCGRFDFVVGNPPYVRIQNLDITRRTDLQRDWQLCFSGSTDIYIAFFELGVKILKENGKLGFITPNTWLKTYAARELRRFFRRQKIVKTLIDFEHWQLFENVTTYSLITILHKGMRHDSFSLLKGDEQGTLRPLGEISVADMRDNNWILCAPKTLKKLHAMTKRREPLSAIANIHVGVTTLADKGYIFQAPVFAGEVAHIRHPQSGKTIMLESNLLRPIVKASIIKQSDEEQHRYILFPYQKNNGKNRLIAEDELAETYPLAYAYFRSIKNTLDKRDKGKKNAVGWYAFGRSQGLDTSFGEKILTSPMNRHPNFVVWKKPEYTFYSGYCIKFGGDLNQLARCLNSEDMAFYINTVSRDYRHQYKSFAKSFLLDFPVPALEITQHAYQSSLV